MEQVNSVIRLCPPAFEIRPLPLNFNFTASDESLRPSVIALIVEASGRKPAVQVKAVRKKFPAVPLLALAPQPQKDDILAAFRAGADDFLPLPLDKEGIAAALSRLATKHKAVSGMPSSFFSRSASWLKEAVGGFRKKRRLLSGNLGILSSPYRSLFSHAPGQKTTAADLNVRFFGRFEVYAQGKALKRIPGSKINSLLAYFVFNHGKAIHREILMNEFWGENTPSSARNSLNVAIHSLRKYFQEALPIQEIILYKNECYSLNPGLDVTSDVRQFLDYWQKGKLIESSQGLENALGAYNKAKALYRGDFIENIHTDEWPERERDNLKEIYLLLLERLSSYFFQHQAYNVSLDLYKKILDADPCQESIHRQVMISYQMLGQRDKAIKQYQRCLAALKEELGVKPSEETKSVFEKISCG